jgi:rSAM/selenodomain-associated transferase 1
MQPSIAGRLTAIVTKAPEPGTVKTRLSPPLAPAEAAALAEAMLRDTVARTVADQGSRPVLCFTPAAAAGWFRRAFPELADQRPQRGEGLGARLAWLFEELLGAPETRSVVALGSDQPLLPGGVVGRAHAALERGADVVLGPDAGGGYYLVGARAVHPELFLEVPMSSPSMCAATVALARARGLAVELLEEAYDVDVPADLQRLAADLERLVALHAAGGPYSPRHTPRWLRGWESAAS